MPLVSGYFYLQRRGEGVGEKEDFEQDTRDRLTRIETLLQLMSTTCPNCQARINALEVDYAGISASAKSAHHRLDNIKSDVVIVVGIIGVVFTVLNYLVVHGAVK